MIAYVKFYQDVGRKVLRAIQRVCECSFFTICDTCGVVHVVALVVNVAWILSQRQSASVY